jgi:hypothetical protein
MSAAFIFRNNCFLESLLSTQEGGGGGLLLILTEQLKVAVISLDAHQARPPLVVLLGWLTTPMEMSFFFKKIKKKKLLLDVKKKSNSILGKCYALPHFRGIAIPSTDGTTK